MIPALLAAALLNSAPASPPCVQAGSSNTHYTPVDDRTIVIESGRQAWKLTVSPTSQLRDPGAFLINEVTGISWLCRPIDFQLSVASQPIGFRTGMIAQTFEPISLAEAKALLKRR